MKIPFASISKKKNKDQRFHIVKVLHSELQIRMGNPAPTPISIIVSKVSIRGRYRAQEKFLEGKKGGEIPPLHFRLDQPDAWATASRPYVECLDSLYLSKLANDY